MPTLAFWVTLTGPTEALRGIQPAASSRSAYCVWGVSMSVSRKTIGGGSVYGICRCSTLRTFFSW